MNDFSIGQRVARIEEREIVDATVLAVDIGAEGRVYLIAYDEGGEGWWPENALVGVEAV